MVGGSTPPVYPILAYCSQNFRKKSPITRLSPKKNILLIMRNYILLYLSTRQVFLGFWQTLVRLESNHILQVLFKYGFRSTLIKKTVDVLKFNSYPVGLAFTNTLKYWLLRNNLLLLDSSKNSSRSLNVHNTLRSKQYFTGTPYILTRSTKKTFKIVFTKILLFLSFSWVQWSRNVKISHQHTTLQRNFYLFRFLNVYYSKVFQF